MSKNGVERTRTELTATDRLCELLDEQNVPHDTFFTTTTWPAGQFIWRATENEFGQLSLITWMDCITPEQAVEATLGRGTCRDVGDVTRFKCSECGCEIVVQDRDWDATMWVGGESVEVRHCPNCGRRVER